MSLDSLTQLGHIIDQVSKDKGFNREVIINSVIQGMLTAIRKKYGTYRDIEVKYNEESGEVELFEFKKVVADAEFEDELIEIKYSEAVHLDSEAQLEDQIGTKLEIKDLGRIDAQMAKQIIVQNLRSAENEVIFNEFEKRKGEIASGIVRRVDLNMIVVELDKTEAYIPRKEQIPGEVYKSGDRIQGYLLEVRQTTRGPQIIMSRAHENYLIKLFETEVPEIYEGIIKIVGVAREPGQRAKMSVYSMDASVHPVGACVGVKGSRVQNITQELKGERIDVIVWEDNQVQYVCNALAPAKIVRVVVDEENKKMKTIVPEDQLSLAIGKKGQNVRLAVKLTGWNLDLVSESDFERQKKEALFNLSLLNGVTETMAQSIYQYELVSIQDVASASLSTVTSIPGYEDAQKAKELILSAQQLIKDYKSRGEELPQLADVSPQDMSSNLKERADEILKKELAELESEDQRKEQEELAQTAQTDEPTQKATAEPTQTEQTTKTTQKATAEPVQKDEPTQTTQKATAQEEPVQKATAESAQTAQTDEPTQKATAEPVQKDEPNESAQTEQTDEPSKTTEPTEPTDDTEDNK